jgi:hypothetical protein
MHCERTESELPHQRRHVGAVNTTADSNHAIVVSPLSSPSHPIHKSIEEESSALPRDNARIPKPIIAPAMIAYAIGVKLDARIHRII